MKARILSPQRLWKVLAICVGVLAIAAVLLWKQQERSFQKAIDEANEAKLMQTLGALKNAVDAYRAEFGTNPIGNSRMIIDALKGNNPGRLRLIIFGGDQGEMQRDPWGEEYRILRKELDTVPEFYSTGPDQIDEQCRIGSDDIRLPQNKNADQASSSNGG